MKHMKSRLTLETEKMFTTGQKLLQAKHGTPAEFAKACYECVPSDISMDEANAAIEKYNKEWHDARRII